VGHHIFLVKFLPFRRSHSALSSWGFQLRQRDASRRGYELKKCGSGLFCD